MRKLAAILTILLFAAPAFAITAQEIVKTMDANMTFDEGGMVISMVDIKNSRVNKTLVMNIKYKKDKGTLLEFTAPAREKNKKILMVKDNMWMFVPGISKPVRLSGKDSFMGTSFSNRDMTDFEMNTDYSSKILSETDKQYKLELTATNKNVAYSKIVMLVDKERLIAVREELFTVSGNMIKTMELSEIKEMGGKLRPSVIVIKDVLTQGAETKVIFENMAPGKLEDNIFSPQNLAR